MSNTTTFAVGLGTGLAAWYLTKPATPDSKGLPEQAATNATTPRNCAVRIDSSGLTVDGKRTDASEAARRCAAGAALTVTRNAPASTYAELMAALGTATRTDARNARGAKATRARARNRETSSNFTLVIYPNGLKGDAKRVLWFRTDAPMTWEAARDQLAAAGVIDRSAIGPNMAGYWKLTTEPQAFNARQARRMPNGVVRARDASSTAKRYTREGRTILRDGEAILQIERVDLGNERYAISPHHADLLAQRIVVLFNRHGA